MTSSSATDALENRDLTAWRPVRIDEPTLEAAWQLEDRLRLSFRDALIVASAQVARCTTLLTEDVQHDLDMGGLRVADPFRIPLGSVT